ncbi:MAG TPA: hypothetical protein VFU60_19475 [Ktedonobacterales bacterium]|nr:hypothetical protein [Ktedonobacterales bacterium]
MAFIQVEQSVVTHRKTLRLARLLNLDRYAVVGRLVALWSWCLDNALDGRLGHDIDPDILADVMAWSTEMGKPGELVDALIAVGWLDVDPADGCLHIHDWHDHMGRFIEERQEKREQAAERQRRFRERQRREREREQLGQAGQASGDASVEGEGGVTVTSRARHAHVTLQEKRREEQSDTTGRVGSGERENAREVSDTPDAPAAAADAALSLMTPDRSSARSAQPDRQGSAAKAPIPIHAPIHAARVPDPVWDACIASMGQNGQAPSNRVERGRWAKGIQALKESLASDGSPPSEVSVRAARYRARFGSSVPLNPMALAGNWTTLAHDIPEEDRRHGNFGQGYGQGQRGRSASAGSGAYGRSAGRSGGGSRGPAIGSEAYYAEALAEQARRQAHDAGGAASEGQRNAFVG